MVIVLVVLGRFVKWRLYFAEVEEIIFVKFFFYVWLSCYSEKDELEKYQYDWICFVPTKHGYSKMDFKNLSAKISLQSISL